MLAQRDTYYDGLRVFAMFGVIGIHAIGAIYRFGRGPAAECLSNALMTFNELGVPLFFTLSGVFLLGREYGDLKDFYYKRFVRVVIPYLVYAFITVFYFVGVEHHDYAAVVPQYVVRVLTANVNVTHWFVYAILALYLITPLVSKLLCALSDKELCILLACVLAACVLIDVHDTMGIRMEMCSGPLHNSERFLLIFNKNNILSYTAGYCLLHLEGCDRYRPYIRGLKWPVICIGMALALCGLFKCYYPVAAFLMIPCAARREDRNERADRALRFVSGRSYSVYLIQAVSLSIILKSYNTWTVYYCLKAILIYLAVFFVSLAISLPVDWCIAAAEKKLGIIEAEKNTAK